MQPLSVSQRPNQVWPVDFMSDALHIEIDTSITGRRLINVFERLRQERGLPGTSRVDKGPEFLNGDFVAWSGQAGMQIQYTQPGQPNQNAEVECFNKTFSH